MTIIIISIFKEDNVFSIIASLPYGPPMNTDIDYYQTFFFLSFFSDFHYFCKFCKVSCAIFVRMDVREASSTKSTGTECVKQVCLVCVDEL